jgi:hypothetical protein
MTKRECQREAREAGAVAVCFRDGRCETISRIERYCKRSENRREK